MIINIFGIGDVLFTTPFISNLKANFPKAKIGYLCNKRAAPILANYQKINKLFLYERDDFLDVLKESKWEFLKKASRLLAELKRERFDVVFDFSLSSSADFLMWLIGIKERIGLSYKDRSHFLTKKFCLEGFETKHVVEYYLDILLDLGLTLHTRSLEIDIPKEDQMWADEFLKKHHVRGPGVLVGILPGAGLSWGKQAYYRRWEIEKYAQLVDKIIEKFSVKIILLGDKSEADLCQRLMAGRESYMIEAFGQTTIGQLAALFQRCHMVVLNDGGPLHVALAAGTKTVSIFGPVDEHVYGPYGAWDKHLVVTREIVCRPCYRRFRMTDCQHISCLRGITPEEVFQKVEQLLYHESQNVRSSDAIYERKIY